MNESNDSRFFYGWIILFGCVLISFVYGFFYNFGVFFKPLQAEFGWSRALTSTLSSVSTITYCIAAVLVGWLTDKVGPRTVLIICAVLVGAGLALSGLANSLWQLYICWAGMLAVGCGVIYALPAATVQRWFVKRRGIVLGIYMSGIGLGTLILSLLCNYLIAAYGWRNAFHISGAIGFVILFIPAFLIYRTPEERGFKPYGAKETPVGQSPASPSAEQGLTAKEALRSKAFWIVWGIHTLASIPLLIVMVHIVPHCIDMGISKAAAAGALGLIAGVGIAGRLLVGAIADKMGFKFCAGISLALCSVMMLFLIPIRSIWMIYLFAIVFGIGYGGKSATMPGLLGYLMGTRALPVLVGVVATAWGVAGTLGPPLGGYVFDITHSYTVAFIVGAVCYAIASFLAFTVKQPEKLRL